MTTTMNMADTSNRELLFTRLIDAPRDLVFEVWTNPEHLIHWWGPNGFSNTFKEFNVKPGGVWRFTMHGPHGMDFPNKVEYTEVVKPSRLVYKHGTDSEENAWYFNVTVDFEEHEGGTRLTMKMVFNTEEDRDRVVKDRGAVDGNKQTMDKMEAYIRGIQTTDGGPELVITRELDAPRELVWKAWTQKEALAQWWGPVGFAIDVHKFELKPGGFFHYSMDNSQGFKMWGRFEFKEINAPEKLVFINSFSDETGAIQRAPFFDGKWALEIKNTLTLTENNGKTTLTLRGYPINATAEEMEMFHTNRASMQGGFKGTFEQLEKYLGQTSDRELVISRSLDAPVETVWEVWTNPEHIKNWWGPTGFTNTIDIMDVRPGGTWEFVMHGPDGTDYKNKSVYKEIVKHQRIVFDHVSGPKFTATITFTPNGNKTELTWSMLFESAEQFQQVVKTFRADEGQKQNVIKLQKYLADTFKN